MFSILLPIASKIVSDAVDKIPEDAELGEKLIDLCLVILKKAVKLTKTDMDDKLLEQVEKAIQTRWSLRYPNHKYKLAQKFYQA